LCRALAIHRKIDHIAVRPQAIHQLLGGLRIVLDHKYVMRIAGHRVQSLAGA
jgi:hypothetical protein